MFLLHYGHVVAGLVLIVFSFVASYSVIRKRREPGSPRWPLLTFFLAVALRGLDFCRATPTDDFLSLSTLSAAVLWFSVGALITQWVHENAAIGGKAGR
jgi:hypothetical protein